ncbi:MAG: hypothetical protein RIC35_15875 [Marinoscillum sp.]
MMLIFVLVPFQEYFGMPIFILLCLGGVALLFAIYSFSCYQFLGSDHSYFLRGIAVANFLYMIVTVSLVVALWDELTYLGIGYFILESGVILSLVVIELKS